MNPSEMYRQRSTCQGNLMVDLYTYDLFTKQGSLRMNLKENDEIMVSVCVITYNQESYIRQAIESALMQTTSFNFELVVGEDFSTDHTRTILEQYQLQFPDKIRLLLNTQNVGAVRNLANTIKECKGKYIALLEGDDYWTSSDKLQKQVNFLESNPDYVICYHATQLIDQKGAAKLILPIPKFRKSTATLQDLLVNDSFMATCSIMFRAKLFDYFPDIFFVLRNGCDWTLNVLNAEHGLIGYLDEIMSVYRSASSEFAWTSKPLTEIYSDAIKINEAFDAYFYFKYEPIFRAKLAKYYCIIAVDYMHQGQLKESFRAMKKSVKKQWIPSLFFRSIFIDGPSMCIRGWLLRSLPTVYHKLKSILHNNG